MASNINCLHHGLCENSPSWCWVRVATSSKKSVWTNACVVASLCCRVRVALPQGLEVQSHSVVSHSPIVAVVVQMLAISHS